MAKVLVVDDDKNFCSSIGYFLASKGYEPVLAKDGTEALVKFEQTSPQAILLDILLPKLNGLDVCKKIREAGERVPIILTSAIYKKPEMQTEAKSRFGANDYLVKPIKPEELIRCLNKMIKKEDDHDDGDVELVPIHEKAAVPQEHQDRDGSLPYEGDIQKGTLIRFIRHLHGKKASGVLEILCGKEKRMVFILNGKPVFASSFSFSDSYTRENVRKILASCLSIEEGSYYFNEGLDFLDYVPTYDLPFSF